MFLHLNQCSSPGLVLGELFFINTMKRLISSTLLSILAILSLSNSAKAETIKLYEDSTQTVRYWIIEEPTNPTVKVRWSQYGQGAGFKPGNFITNQCGIGYFSLPDTVLKFNIGSLQFTPTTAASAPICNSDGTTSMANNTAVRVGTKSYVRYMPDPETPIDSWAANWPDIRDRKATPNQCGFVKWKTTSITEIEVNGVMAPKANFTALPLEQMPICRKIGTGYVKYVRLTP